MKFRNNWESPKKQWDKVLIKLKLANLEFFAVEIDVTRNFYLLTILNFTIKNR